MAIIQFYKPFLICILLLLISCNENKQKGKIIESIGVEEYTRLMNLDRDNFDQSSVGFRQYSNNYELISAIIPEYISENKLSPEESRNLHWHLGQIHAFNGNYNDAIVEMKQSYSGGSKTWECYVTGSIAFLEKDKETLLKALDTLGQQENIMNIEILHNFVDHFDESYVEAINAGY